MEDEEERLLELIDLVEQFNLGLVKRYCALGVDVMGYAEDLGMQNGPMLSPRQFRQYILPSYRRLIAPAREAGAVIHMHSDGMLHQLAEDILSVGVDVLNLQDLVNGIDWIRREIETLGSKEGGLCLIYGLYPGTPLENAGAVMDAMERYMGYFA